MKRIEIERDNTTHTPVTTGILDMLKKLSAWTPKTMEQVIEVGNRLIHAANMDIFHFTTKECNNKQVSYFMAMKGKMIKYHNGIKHSPEYIYVTRVEIQNNKGEPITNITGIRLAKYNRIGNDTVQLYTIHIHFSSVVEMSEDAFTVFATNYRGQRVKYSIVSDFTEYTDAVARMKAFVPMVQSIPENMTQDMVKISLHKKPFITCQR